MYEQIVFSGFGGQGIQSMSKMLARCAMAAGLQVSVLPAYGGSMRGGTSNVTVIVSDGEIASPMPCAGEVTAAVVMNNPSLVKIESYLRPGGLLLLNRSLIDLRPVRGDVEVLAVPANEMAEELGNARATNMIMLGCLLARTGMVLPSVMEGMIGEFFAAKEKLIPLNREAFGLGVRFVKEGGGHDL